jgi:hypothetical protein
MKTEAEIRARIHRIRMIRAGSIFSREFEAGELFMLLWVLGEEPNLKNYEEVFLWGRKMVGDPEYSKSVLEGKGEHE